MMKAINSALLILVALFAITTCVRAYLPQPEAARLCRLRTGLKDGDIKQHHVRNQNCALDCETLQGTLMRAQVDDGSPCNDQDGYKCVMGVCRGDDDKKFESELKSMDLSSFTIGIRTAFVADRDPYPGQGESDAFVVVELVSSGGPAYKEAELICHTHVIQDTSRPKWNFFCKPPPMNSAAKLRFVVMDSDKPDSQPQLLGQTTQTVSSLLNAGPQTLILEQAKHVSGADGPYWLEVELKGKKYSPSE